MVRKTTLFVSCLCVIFAGQMLAGNTEKSPVSKYANVFLKTPKGFGKSSEKRATHLRSTDDNAAPSVQLRATLEPGHNKPDSAVIFDVYDGGASQSPYEKIVFSYNDNGDITETFYDRSGEGWKTSYYEKKYAFDAHGNQTLYASCDYNEKGEITYGEKSESAYNSNGTPLSAGFYEWENGQWIADYEMKMEYTDGMLTGGTYTTKGTIFPLTVTGTWENLVVSIVAGNIVYHKEVYHYNPADMKLMNKEIFDVNEETGELELTEAIEYTYDAAGRKLTEVYKYENYEGEGSDVNFKVEYVYNAAGQKLYVTESYSEDGGAYIDTDKKEYEYIEGRLAKTKKYYNDEDNNLELVETAVFYYSDGTGNEQVMLTDISVYPNPVADVLTISNAPAGAVLTMVDMSGRMVLRQTLTGEQETLSVASLPAGYYIATVQSGVGTATYKIIKK